MSMMWMVVSALLVVGAVIPYIIDIQRNNAKPKIVTWFIWTVLTGIGCVASFADGQIPSGLLTLVMTAQTGTVVILLLAKGRREKLAKLDRWCLVGALVGLLLWPIFNSPTVTIVAMIAIDLVGAVPTLWHAWKEPHEEKGITFALTGLAGFITLVAAGSWEVSAVAYPVYLLLLYASLTGIVTWRQYFVRATKEPDLVQ